jgi:hypothetical protein
MKMDMKTSMERPTTIQNDFEMRISEHGKIMWQSRLEKVKNPNHCAMKMEK